MRDIIKTREYFDEFILEETKRIEKFQARIKNGTLKSDRLIPVNYKIIQIKIGIIIAKYSRGDSIEDIKLEFEALIDMICEKGYVSIYEDNLCLASIAYLLDISMEKIMRLRNKFMESDTYDYLIDFVLVGLESDMDSEKISFLRQYKKILKFIDDGKKETFLKYLRGWYQSHFHSSWYDTHKNEKYKLYYGYWCFEAGAVAKRIGISDEDLQNEQYYPYDMIHFR